MAVIVSMLSCFFAAAPSVLNGLISGDVPSCAVISTPSCMLISPGTASVRGEMVECKSAPTGSF